MYAKPQRSELRNRMDEGWNINQKVSVYKNLIGLYQREKHKDLSTANTMRQELTKKTQELRKDCKFYNSSLGNTLYVNKLHLRRTLDNRPVRLAYAHKEPKKLLEYLEHGMTKRQRELDLLKYRKKQRMGVLTNLQLEKGQLEERLELGLDSSKILYTVQTLRSKVQGFVVRQNAAVDIYALYKHVLDLLQKDSRYMDNILTVIRKDYEEQCHCMLKAVEMSQLAHEDRGEVLNECKWLERAIKIRIKFRGRELKQLRKKVEDLYEKCKQINRHEFAQLALGPMHSMGRGLKTEEVDEQEYLEAAKLRELEDLVKQVQESTASPTCCDVLPILLRQLEHEETLKTMKNKMETFKQRLILMKQHSEEITTTCTEQWSSSEIKYKEDIEQLSKATDEEKFRLKRFKEDGEEHTQMLAKIRLALQSVFETVSRVKEVVISSKTFSLLEIEQLLRGKSLGPEDIEKTFFPPIEEDPVLLVKNMKERLENIVPAAELGEEHLSLVCKMRQRQTARTRYEEYLSERPIEYSKPLVEDKKIEDINIPSREDVKISSKHLVEKYQPKFLKSTRRSK